MFAGMSLLPLSYALVIHAIGAPIIAGLVAWVYFKQLRPKLFKLCLKKAS
jgi:hypothetical protein